MNDFVAQKLGEVIAFARIGKEFRERAGTTFDKALDRSDEFVHYMESFADEAARAGTDTTHKKADKSTKKLRSMMEAYVGNHWDNPIELLEWLSFFVAASAAHWSIIRGATEKVKDKHLEATATKAMWVMNSYLEIIDKKLEKIGRQKALAT